MFMCLVCVCQRSANDVIAEMVIPLSLLKINNTVGKEAAMSSTGTGPYSGSVQILGMISVDVVYGLMVVAF